MPITSTILYNFYRDLKSSIFPSSTPKHISEAIESATENSSASVSESLSETISESLAESISTSESLTDSDFLEAFSESYEYLGSATNSPINLNSKLISESASELSSGQLMEMPSIQSTPQSSWSQIGQYFTKSNLLIGGGMALITGGCVVIYMNRQRIKALWQNDQLENDF